MHRNEPHVHVCPLCATLVEVEGGYDGPYYEWFCDHNAQLGYDAEPERVPLWVLRDSAELERRRAEWCRRIFDEQLAALRARPPLLAYLHFGKGKDGFELRYIPEHRRLRKEWRDLGWMGQMDVILKQQYAEPIREALNQGSMFLAAMLGEERDMQIDMRKDLNRQAYGDTFIVPIKKR